MSSTCRTVSTGIAIACPNVNQHHPTLLRVKVIWLIAHVIAHVIVPDVPMGQTAISAECYIGFMSKVARLL